MSYNLIFYNDFKRLCANGTINLATDHVKVALLTSSHTFVGTHTDWSQVSPNELANGNGYTASGLQLTNTTWTQTGGIATYAADTAIWTAGSSSFGPVRYAVLYSDTSSNDKLIACIDFGSNQTAGAGTDFKITWNVNGIFRFN